MYRATRGARALRARAPRVGCTFLLTFLSFALIFYYNYCNNYPPPRLRAWRAWVFFLTSVLCALVLFCLVLKMEKRGGVWGCAPIARAPPEPTKTPSFFHRFFDAFLDRLFIDLSSIFPPNMPPQNNKNQLKIDAKRHPILDFKF